MLKWEKLTERCGKLAPLVMPGGRRKRLGLWAAGGSPSLGGLPVSDPGAGGGGEEEEDGQGGDPGEGGEQAGGGKCGEDGDEGGEEADGRG